MNPIGLFPTIKGWVLGQGTLNTPEAAIYALAQYDRQTAGGNRHLVIVDSSPAVSQATAFYEEIARKRDDVFYFHMPFRPGHETALDIEHYPLAYRWHTDPEFKRIYETTIPDDEELAIRYILQPDIASTLQMYGPRAFGEIVECVRPDFREGDDVPYDVWAEAVTEFTRRGGFHARPHLGSKRNFMDGVARKLGAQVVANLDDDYYGPEYVESQLRALQNSHMTGKMKYVTLIYTQQAIDAGTDPIWAVTELNNAGRSSFLLDHQGNRIPGEPAGEQRSMGWTQARRVCCDIPPAPDILCGEDRGKEDRLADRYSVYLQSHFCPGVIRIVFGHSSSNNLIKRVIIDADDHRLPPPEVRDEVLAYVRAICGRGELPAAVQANNILRLPRRVLAR